MTRRVIRVVRTTDIGVLIHRRGRVAETTLVLQEGALLVVKVYELVTSGLAVQPDGSVIPIRIDTSEIDPLSTNVFQDMRPLDVMAYPDLIKYLPKTAFSRG